MMIGALILLSASVAVPSGEQPVTPYTQSDANAGATPFPGQAMWLAFHKQDGVDRIVDNFVSANAADRRIGDIFRGQDLVRLRRTLKEQFCFILGGGCSYTGRDMKSAHKDLGVQSKDMNVLVTNLQRAMNAEHVSFAAQGRFLAKLAPMKKAVVTR